MLLLVRVHRHGELLAGRTQQVEYDAQVRWTRRSRAAAHVCQEI